MARPAMNLPPMSMLCERSGFSAVVPSGHAYGCSPDGRRASLQTTSKNRDERSELNRTLPADLRAKVMNPTRVATRSKRILQPHLVRGVPSKKGSKEAASGEQRDYGSGLGIGRLFEVCVELEWSTFR